MNCEGRRKNITSKTNDVNNIVHRYYFYIYNTRVAKKITEEIVSNWPRFPLPQINVTDCSMKISNELRMPYVSTVTRISYFNLRTNRPIQ
jgi:hypothetical protein